MKRLSAVIFLLLLSQASLAAINVLSCEPEWAALAIALGGNHVNVYSATTALQDPHTIQARPSLIAKARTADLLVCSGAELEIGWLPLLLQKSGNNHIQPGQPGYFIASDHVDLLEKGANADRNAGDIHLAGNPHIQTSPYNMLKVADALLPVLQKLIPEHVPELQQRHADFTQKMQQALQQWQAVINQLQGKKVVVYHDNWIYLNAWLGMSKVATLEPKPGVPPNTRHLATLLKQLQETPANLIIYSVYQDKKPATWLAEKTAIPVAALPATIEKWQEPDAIIQWYGQLLAIIKGTAL